MSFKFDGTNDFLFRTPPPITGYGTEGFTVSAWFRPATLGATDVIAMLGTPGDVNNFFSCRMDTTGAIVAACANNTGTGTLVPTTNTAYFTSGGTNLGPNNGWNHGLFVYASSTSRRAVLNGNWGSSGFSSQDRNTTVTPTHLIIGSDQSISANNPNQEFTGNEGFLAFWNTTLTQAEGELLAAGADPRTIRPDRLVALYTGKDPLNLGKDIVGSFDVAAVNQATYEAVDPPVNDLVVVIDDAGDESFFNGESITLVGSGFGATQGTGSVKISPTNNVADAGAVAQNVTAWSDTSITFTVVKGSLNFLVGLNLFVTKNGGTSNATGYPVQIEPRVFIRETLVSLSAAPAASQTGLNAMIWRAAPTGAPAQELTGLTTNASGLTAWEIARGSLAVNDPIWLAVFKDGSPAKATMRKITPSYE